MKLPAQQGFLFLLIAFLLSGCGLFGEEQPGVGLVVKERIFIVPDFYWFLDYVDLLKSYELKQGK